VPRPTRVLVARKALAANMFPENGLHTQSSSALRCTVEERIPPQKRHARNYGNRQIRTTDTNHYGQGSVFLGCVESMNVPQCFANLVLLSNLSRPAPEAHLCMVTACSQSKEPITSNTTTLAAVSTPTCVVLQLLRTSNRTVCIHRAGIGRQRHTKETLWRTPNKTTMRS